jgi:hypothetical protein
MTAPYSAEPDPIPDTVPCAAGGASLSIPEVFDPVPYADFCRHQAHRMARRADDPAVVVQLRWIARQLCISGIAFVDAVVARESLGPLQLLIESPIDGTACGRHLRVVADDIVRIMRANHPVCERVHDHRGEVHLLRPFHLEAACGTTSGAWGESTGMPLTCRACIGQAYRQSHPASGGLHRVALSEDELDRLAPRAAREQADRLLGLFFDRQARSR